jgi:hypothetical protein
MYTWYIPVNEESCLAISCVTGVITPPSFNEFIIKVVCHLGFGVAIYKPEEIAVMILHTILCVMLLPQEPANIKSTVYTIPPHII